MGQLSSRDYNVLGAQHTHSCTNTAQVPILIPLSHMSNVKDFIILVINLTCVSAKTFQDTQDLGIVF
jgi:hypothetical protein